MNTTATSPTDVQLLTSFATNYPEEPVTRAEAFRATQTSASGLDQTRYWVGAGLTAAIGAVGGIVGLVVAHGILHVPVLLESNGHLTAVHVAAYAALSGALALAAAGLFDAMLHIAPRPLTYYTWLSALGTLLAVLLPFTTTAGLHSQIALGAMNLVVGLIITLLVPVAASNARRNPRDKQSARL